MSKSGSRDRHAPAHAKRAGVAAKQRKAGQANESARSGSARSGRAASSATSARAGESGESLDPAGDSASLLEQILPEGKLYYRIGEVSDITGVKAYVLRYWESEFRWMAPQKSRSKQRLYRRKDIEMILLIRKLLYEERYTIAGARQRLRELGAGKASAVAKAKQHESMPASPAHKSPDGAAALAADYRRQLREIKRELVSIRASL